MFKNYPTHVSLLGRDIKSKNSRSSRHTKHSGHSGHSPFSSPLKNRKVKDKNVSSAPVISKSKARPKPRPKNTRDIDTGNPKENKTNKNPKATSSNQTLRTNKKHTGTRRRPIKSSIRQCTWIKHVGESFHSKCLCCYTKDINVFNFHAAHIKAHCKGGEDTVDNLIPTCANCNQSMGDINLYEFQTKCGFQKPPLYFLWKFVGQ